MAETPKTQGPARTGDEVLARNRDRLEALRVPGAFKDDFASLVDDSVGSVWRRPGLTPAQRSIATIAMMAALGRLGPLREHVAMGLDNGLDREEICELMFQCAVYAGFPTASVGFEVVTEVFEEEGSS